VEEAFKLLKNPKKAQKAHLLFARGSHPKEVLKLRVSLLGAPCIKLSCCRVTVAISQRWQEAHSQYRP
jgi:hypothetical protein